MQDLYVLGDYLTLRARPVALPCPERCGPSDEEPGMARGILYAKDTDHRAVAELSVHGLRCDYCGLELDEDQHEAAVRQAVAQAAGVEDSDLHLSWNSALKALTARDGDLDTCAECGCDRWNGDHEEWCTRL